MATPWLQPCIRGGGRVVGIDGEHGGLLADWQATDGLLELEGWEVANAETPTRSSRLLPPSLSPNTFQGAGAVSFSTLLASFRPEKEKEVSGTGLPSLIEALNIVLLPPLAAPTAQAAAPAAVAVAG